MEGASARLSPDSFGATRPSIDPFTSASWNLSISTAASSSSMLCECVGGTSTLGCLLMDLTSGHQMVLPYALDWTRSAAAAPSRGAPVA